MDNIGDKAMGGSLLLPMLAGTLGPRTPLQMLAVDDIGRAAAAAFTDPSRYAGARIDLVGDVLTVPQLRQVLARSTGHRPARWSLPTSLASRLSPEFTAQLRWQVRAGFVVPRPGTASAFPGLQDLAQHLRARRTQEGRTQDGRPVGAGTRGAGHGRAPA